MNLWLILLFLVTNVVFVISIQSSGVKCGVKFKTSDLTEKGTASQQNEWPWHVSLHWLPSEKYLCGGTIVSTHQVLTAAHCVVRKRQGLLNPEDVKVYVGKHNLTSVVEKFEWFIPYHIDVHPDWKVSENEDSYDADIAVLFVAFPIPFSKAIAPICLWTDLSEDEDYVGTVVGWGEFGISKISDVPNQLRVQRVPSARCYEDFHLIAAIASSRTFCAGSAHQNLVPCRGFSGGGFFIQENGIWFIQGIVSSTILRSNRCNASKYSLFTKINEFLTWINIKSTDHGIDFTAFIQQNYFNRNGKLVTISEALGLSVRLPLGHVDIDNKKKSVMVDGLRIAKQDAVYFPYGFNALYPNLTTIEVIESNLKFIDRKSFENMDKLRRLKIEGNPISSIPHDALYEVKSLEILWIENCRMSNLHPDILAKSLNLEVLRLANNQLETLPSDLLRNNLKLTDLYVTNNRIKFIDDELFANLEYLEFIDFNQNFLHNISDIAFHDLKALKYLYLEYNRLKSLPTELLSNNLNLKHFLVKFNQIDSIASGIFNEKSELEWISLDQNNVMRLEEKIFEDQTSLETLFLDGMKISQLSVGLFQTLTKLKLLSIQTNELTTLDKNLLRNNVNLIEFKAAYNWIEDLDSSFFESNSELKGIYLSNNRIKNLARGLFSNLKNLESLELNFNYIASISEDTFKGLFTLQEVSLNGNSFDSQNENFIRKILLPDTKVYFSNGTEFSDEEIIEISSQWKLQENSTSKKYQRNDPSICGRKFKSSGLIVKGTATNLEQWPWLASLLKLPLKEFFCGGSIISQHHVLTAAHCLHNKHRNQTVLEPSEFSVYLGMHNLSALNDNDYWFHPHEILIHPEWASDAVRFDADIAIVVSDSPTVFSPKISPVCLWTETEEDGNYFGTVVGWGASEKTGFVGNTDIPYEVQVKRVPSEKCYEDQYQIAKIGSSRSFCAGGVAENSGPCNGDSGGGYFVRLNDVWYLQGIVSSTLFSTTKTCDVSTYSLYTKINEFLSWINLRNKAYEIRLRGFLEQKQKKNENEVTTTFTTNGLVVTQPSSNVILDQRRSMMKVDVVKITEENHVVYFPSGFGRIFPTVKQLEISNANMRFVEGQSFKHMKQLLKLKIHDNPIKNLPIDVFAELMQLETLEIKRTQIVLLPQDLLSELSNLRSLNLSFNQIDSLPDGLLRNNLKLKFIDLSYNQIKFIEGNDFKNLEELEKLFLNNNRIQDISPESFSSLKNLLLVYLESNRIKTLHSDTFAQNKKLEYLYLSFNLIEDLPTKLLRQNLRLKEVYLFQNKIKEFSIFVVANNLFRSLNQLQLLDLRSMYIRFLPHDFFFDLKSLQSLLIDANSLEVLHKDLLTGNRDLENFYASFNQIRELHPDFFQNSWKLLEIVLLSNQLTSISSTLFKNLTSLVELQLAYNLIETIEADAFSDLKSLQKMFVGNNELKILDENLFKNLGNLIYLDMSFNQIEYLSSKLFRNNHALKSFILNDNNLMTIDIDFSPNRDYDRLSFIGNKCVSVGGAGETLKKNKVEIIEEIVTKCSSRSRRA